MKFSKSYHADSPLTIDTPSLLEFPAYLHSSSTSQCSEMANSEGGEGR